MFSAARTQLAAEGQLAQSETPTATVPAAVHKALESGREIKRQTPAVPPAKYLDNVRCPREQLGLPLGLVLQGGAESAQHISPG